MTINAETVYGIHNLLEQVGIVFGSFSAGNHQPFGNAGDAFYGTEIMGNLIGQGGVSFQHAGINAKENLLPKIAFTVLTEKIPELGILRIEKLLGRYQRFENHKGVKQNQWQGFQQMSLHVSKSQLSGFYDCIQHARKEHGAGVAPVDFPPADHGNGRNENDRQKTNGVIIAQ
ncbi:CRISPR-associated protein, Cas6 family [Corchorus olitorius]|uniref:CRISPR-associated protein, Cas6 family n=1 Tax=Corchorus olitorius TaxID=93759 RepID=A0A1R3L269_9ROSI|nr:CRISPR-associated protein, Cas6 family [Corchorus olitorius]